MSDKKLSASARRSEEQRREQAQKRKTTRTAAIVAVAVAVIFAVCLFANSGAMRRSAAAVTVADEKVSAAEYMYYFQESITEYQNLMYELYSSEYTNYLPDFNKTLASQTYDWETGQTWADFFKERTNALMRSVLLIAKEAKNANFTLTEIQREDLNAELDELREYVTTYYTNVNSFKEYLQSRYGFAMTEKLYEELYAKRFTVAAYVQDVADAFTYEDGEYETYYGEHRDELDSFAYRSFTVKAALPVQGDLTDEDYAPLRLAAVEEARALADAYAASVNDAEPFPVRETEAEAPDETDAEEPSDADETEDLSDETDTDEPSDEEAAEPVDLAALTPEERFVAAAADYDAEAYADDHATLTHDVLGENLNVSDEIKEWLLDANRVSGDLIIKPDNEDEAAVTSYTLYCFSGRSDNKIGTVNWRYMIVVADSVSTNDYLDEEGAVKQDEYDAAVDGAKAAAETRAEDLYEQWRQAGFTEEALEKMTRENKGDALDGARYDNVPRPEEGEDIDGMDAMLSGWLYDTARQPGDSTLLHTENDAWLLVYYDGDGLRYDRALADVRMRSDALNEWTKQFETAPVVEKWGFRFVG